MNELKKLAESIVKDGKMTSDNVIKFLCDCMEKYECNDEYQQLYSLAYGKKINKTLAEIWVHSMAVTDGSGETDGEKWSLEETTDVGNSSKLAIDWNKICKTDFYVVMNMCYSDFYSIARSVGMQDDPYFYGKMAKAWLMDEDVSGNKLYNYYFHVV